jgi:ABC-type nitrate/sulfonate/bicarbonate transport system substrate-binding protein
MQLSRASYPSRRDFLRIGGLGAVGLAAVACGGTTSAPSPAGAAPAGQLGEVSVQLSWIKNIEFAGEFFADSKGYYKDAGLPKVDLVSGPVASAEALVVAKNITVGLSAPDATARFITEQGAPLKTIGATFQKNPFCITSLTKTPIATPQDMIGKKIGVQAANTAIFEGLLKANNIDKSKLTIVPVQFDPTVLTTGGVEGFVSYLTNEPITLTAAGNEVTTFAFAENGLPLVAETFTVLQETIDKDRAKLKAYLTAEIKGWKDAIASPAETAKLAVEKYGKDQKLTAEEQTKEAEAQNKLIVSPDTTKNGLFTLTDELMAENIEALGRSGVTITADKIFDLSLLKEIYAADASLI